MANVKLSKSTVDRLPLPVGKQELVWDTELKGLGVLLSPGGTKSWVVQFRTVSGRSRRMVIGRCNRVTADQARIAARKHLSAADLGQDPANERHQLRAQPTLKEFMEDWWGSDDAKLMRPGTLKNWRSARDKYIEKKLGSRKLSEIDDQDIKSLHRSISLNHPIAANRVVQFLRKLFNAAIGGKYIATNPAVGIEFNTEHESERFLSYEEIAKIHKELDDTPEQDSADALRIMFWTGARPGEVLGARWDQFDLKGMRWTKPKMRTKQKKIHTIPIPQPVVDILSERKKNSNSEWVFPARWSPTGHRTQVRSLWAAIIKRTGIPTARIYDIRHTYATYLLDSQTNLKVVGKMMGHGDIQSTGRYAHATPEALQSAARAASRIMPVKKRKPKRPAPKQPMRQRA